MFRPASIVSGEKGAFWLNKVEALLVVLLVAPGTAPDQLLGVAQFVSVTPTQLPTLGVTRRVNEPFGVWSIENDNRNRFIAKMNDEAPPCMAESMCGFVS